MKYRISDLVMSRNFQGLYAGSPYQSDYDSAKKNILSGVQHIHPTNESYDDLVVWEWKIVPGTKYGTYGNIVFTTIDFEPNKEKNKPDWYCSNFMFIYYPSLGETLEGKIDEIVKSDKITKHDCYF